MRVSSDGQLESLTGQPGGEHGGDRAGQQDDHEHADSGEGDQRRGHRSSHPTGFALVLLVE